MLARPASLDLVARLAAVEARLASAEARLASAEAEIAALKAAQASEPRPLAEAVLVDFTRIAALVVLGDEFEAGDIADGDDEAQKFGTALGKVARHGPVMGLRVHWRFIKGRKRWTLRPAGVGLGGA